MLNMSMWFFHYKTNDCCSHKQYLTRNDKKSSITKLVVSLTFRTETQKLAFLKKNLVLTLCCKWPYLKLDKALPWDQWVSHFKTTCRKSQDDIILHQVMLTKPRQAEMNNSSVISQAFPRDYHCNVLPLLTILV